MSNFSKDSFLKNAPALDSLFLDVNRLPKIPKTANDEDYIIGHGYDERPDLLAYQLYNNSRLWWVFSLRNPDELRDPIRDFKAGLKIKLPPGEVIKNIV